VFYQNTTELKKFHLFFKKTYFFFQTSSFKATSQKILAAYPGQAL